MASGQPVINTDEEGLRLLRRDKTITRSLERLRFGIRVLDLATSYIRFLNWLLIQVSLMSALEPITFIDTGRPAMSRLARVHGHLQDHLSCGLRIFASLLPSSLSSLAVLFLFRITGA